MRYILPALLLLSSLDVHAERPPEILRLKAALEAQDLAAIRKAVQEGTAALGQKAGQPETATTHFTPIDPAPFDRQALRQSWLADFDRGTRGLPWRKNPAGDPTVMEAGLREAAIPIIALARTVPVEPERGGDLTELVRTGAGWLAQRQHASGVFPLPIGPALHPREKVGFMMQRAVRERPKLVVDGWIATTPGDGGLQFDNGLCETALTEAWLLTREEPLLLAARRSAEWAMAQPLVTNWNYNGFSAGFLARLGRATDETKYVEAAAQKARLGVLPGQGANGRWSDPHNASAAYHQILLRDLLEVYAALPENHVLRADLRGGMVRGLDQAAEETATQGYTGYWAADFARALSLLGENARWRTALNVCVNAALHGGRSLGPEAVNILAFLPEKK